MRVVLSNFGGTIGDVYPFVALAGELQKHGHQPVLALAPYFGPWIKGNLGLEFVPIGPTLEQAEKIVQAEMKNTQQAAHTSGEPHLTTLLHPFLSQVYRELCNVTRDADVLVNAGERMPCGLMVHEKTGIPYVSLQIYYLHGSKTPLGQMSTPEHRREVEARINPFRAELGLAPIRNPLTIGASSPQLTLYALSQHLIPRPPNLPAHHHLTGYFFLDDERWQPDPALSRFIADGERPIFITFGSMKHGNPEGVTNLILDALRLAKCRAIVQRGWSGLAKRSMPPHVFPVDLIPYTWLFPQMACVVHHGGLGTTAAALRAGVPSVFVPHAHDQPTWAQMVHELGCSPAPILLDQLDARRLAWTITQTLNTPRYHQETAALGVKIRSEGGVTKARQLIEELVAREQPAHRHNRLHAISSPSR